MATGPRRPATAAPLVPEERSLEALRSAAAGCTACDLHRTGTQTVFGDGPADAELVLVGEQPGDKEDLAGEPFVGPAGRVLDEALQAAGIDRRRTYVTNAVKHFKWEGTRGKVRLHKTPSRTEQLACRPWLDAELRVIRPSVLVCLGATAAKAVLGPDVRVTRDRGRFLDSDHAPHVMVTVHPSSILRGDPASRAAAMAAFTDDLRVAAGALGR
jgi:uracil-DNA glycosylase